MIADKNLQLASSLDVSLATTPGYLQTADSIDTTQLRDLGAGCPIYGQITIRSDFVEDDGAVSVALFALRGWTNWPGVMPASFPAPVGSAAIDNSVFEYLIPRVGQSETIPLSDLKAGKVITFPINGQALAAAPLLSPWSHDARGMRYLFGTATFWSVSAGLNAPTLVTPVSGTFDFDIVLSPSNGVQTINGLKQAEGPFYPTAITQV
jgi:hypothetical protein